MPKRRKSSLPWCSKQIHAATVVTGGRPLRSGYTDAMLVRWLGQSAFAFSGTPRSSSTPSTRSGSSAGAVGYPPIQGVDADLVLVTHDHSDHNGIERSAATRVVVRSVGRTYTPLGVVTGIASEHDAVAGTERGANVIFLVEFESVVVCHFGDFGQASLRPEQERAIGRPDAPVPPGRRRRPTIDGKTAAAIAKRLAPGYVVPMHYRTELLDWDDLETAEPFAAGQFMPRSATPSELGLNRPRGRPVRRRRSSSSPHPDDRRADHNPRVARNPTRPAAEPPLDDAGRSAWSGRSRHVVPVAPLPGLGAGALRSVDRRRRRARRALRYRALRPLRGRRSDRRG